LVVVVSIIAGGDKRHATPLDIFDEGAHYDYVVALRDHRIPAWGDPLDQRTMRLADCLGYQVGNAGADCSRRPRQPTAFPAGGYSYEAQQPPLGYIPFLVTAKPNADPKVAIAKARHGGALWTAAGAVLLVALAAVEGLSLLGLTLLLATCLLSPVHIYAAATVNNDAAGVAAGAFAWLVASTTSRFRSSTAVGIGLSVGVLLVMIKGIFIVAPFVLVVATLIRERPWTATRGAWRIMVRRNAGVIGMLAGAAVAFVAWIQIQNIRAHVPSSVVLEALLGFTRTDHLRLDSIRIGLRGLTSMLVPYFGDSPTHYLWNLTFFAVVIGVVILKARSPEASDTRFLSIASMVGIATVSVGWTVISYLQGQYDGVATPRYGLCLLPLMAIVVVRSVQRAGLLVLGLLFPVAGVMWQLSGKF
jgi:hypothetical protein